MVRNPYRGSFYRQLIKWVLILSAAVLIGAGIGVLIGRFYFPNVEPWELAILELREQTESDYYRGVMSSCVAIAGQMMLPSESVSATCGVFWQMAYQNDWYEELNIDSWQWPPESSGDN